MTASARTTGDDREIRGFVSTRHLHFSKHTHTQPQNHCEEIFECARAFQTIDISYFDGNFRAFFYTFFYSFVYCLKHSGMSAEITRRKPAVFVICHSIRTNNNNRNYYSNISLHANKNLSPRNKFLIYLFFRGSGAKSFAYQTFYGRFQLNFKSSKSWIKIRFRRWQRRERESERESGRWKGCSDDRPFAACPLLTSEQWHIFYGPNPLGVCVYVRVFHLFQHTFQHRAQVKVPSIFFCLFRGSGNAAWCNYIVPSMVIIFPWNVGNVCAHRHMPMPLQHELYYFQMIQENVSKNSLSLCGMNARRNAGCRQL